MQKIDIQTWNRREIYKQFSTDFHQPFYCVAFKMDITNLFKYVKKEGLPFYFSMIHLATKAINTVENFRYRNINGEIYLLDKLEPSITNMPHGSEIFQVTNCKMEENLKTFCQKVRLMTDSQQTFMGGDEIEHDGIVLFSCNPWLELTTATNPIQGDTTDNIPRICWGKFFSEGDRLKFNMSVQANHCFVDGLHVGKFAKELQNAIDQLQ